MQIRFAINNLRQLGLLWRALPAQMQKVVLVYTARIVRQFYTRAVVLPYDISKYTY